MIFFYIFIAVIVLLFVIPGIYMAIQNNRIPSDLGVSDGKLAQMPKSPNAVSSQTDLQDKKVEPFPIKVNASQSMEDLETIVKNEHAEIIERGEYYFHAVYTSEKMKFKDDVEFLVDEKGSVIHFRSASRVGYSDMGVNRLRYERIFEKYKVKT